MKQFNRTIGVMGEEIAERYLKNRGYEILEKNYSTKFGELDLIATRDDILIFVEVKLKRTEDFGTPEEMIGRRKLAQIQRTANLYLINNTKIENKFKRYRIDAVCIVGDLKNGVRRVNHYRNLTF